MSEAPSNVRQVPPHWLRECYLEVVPDPSVVACARLYTRLTLAAWNLRAIADVAELVVSELMTNAIKATIDMRLATNVALQMARTEERLFLLVWDASPEEPRSQDHDDDSLGGRGLQIVDALSDAWGSRKGDHGGKVVWVVLRAHRAARH